MRIVKFIEFIREELINDTPEQYVATALSVIKKNVDAVFEMGEVEGEEDFDRKKKRGNMEDLGVRLESSEISKYSKLNDSLTVKFSDDMVTYSLMFIIELSEAMPKDKTKAFSHKDIKKCYVKFKKYDLDTFEIIGQLDKNIGIIWPKKSEKSGLMFEVIEDESLEEQNAAKMSVEDFLIYLKNEFDEDFDEGGEGFEIETE